MWNPKNITTSEHDKNEADSQNKLVGVRRDRDGRRGNIKVGD